jgi:hypothetical protein
MMDRAPMTASPRTETNSTSRLSDPLAAVTRLIVGCTVVGVFLVQSHQATSLWIPTLELAVSSGLIFLFTSWMPYRHTIRSLGFIAPYILAVGISLGWELIIRELLATGNPLELTILVALRNVMWCATVDPLNSKKQSVAAASSVLIMLTVYLLLFDVRTSVVMFVYAMASMWWLMGRSWSRLQSKAPGPSQREIPLPAKAVATATALLVVLLGGFAFRHGQATTAIDGFMPTSGGRRWSDPFAMGGVNDGDQMVSARSNASSFGPIESELFLESQQPSIYDVFNDLYNEPVERKKMRSRAIPLAPSDSKENHSKLAENERAAREFSTVRRSRGDRPTPKDLKDLGSDALFYVSGRAPLHLMHEVFDTWDGDTLSYRGNDSFPDLALNWIANQAWVQCGCGPTESRLFASHLENYVLRYARIRTPRVMSPSQLQRVHLDRLHTANFFRWSEDGVIRFVDQDVPRLTVLHAASRPIRRRLLADESFWCDRRSLPPTNPQLLTLIKSWTCAAKTDWQRIDAVVQGIRATCQLDRDQGMEAEVEDVVAEFLLRAKAGPDYLFAVSAATLLRQMGYHTRVIAGFYARPENYLRTADATAVLATDAHFWPEVKTASGIWVPLEPTPGYHIPDARRSASEFAQDVWAAVGATIRRFGFGIVGALISGGLAWVYRHRLALLVNRIRWLAAQRQSSRIQVRRTLDLLDAHARLYHCTRPNAWTIRRWITSLEDELSAAEANSVREFELLCQWALYGSSFTPPTNANVVQLCDHCVRLLSQQMKRSRA